MPNIVLTQSRSICKAYWQREIDPLKSSYILPAKQRDFDEFLAGKSARAPIVNGYDLGYDWVPTPVLLDRQITLYLESTVSLLNLFNILVTEVNKKFYLACLRITETDQV